MTLEEEEKLMRKVVFYIVESSPHFFFSLKYLASTTMRKKEIKVKLEIKIKKKSLSFVRLYLDSKCEALFGSQSRYI